MRKANAAAERASTSNSEIYWQAPSYRPYIFIKLIIKFQLITTSTFFIFGKNNNIFSQKKSKKLETRKIKKLFCRPFSFFRKKSFCKIASFKLYM